MNKYEGVHRILVLIRNVLRTHRADAIAIGGLSIIIYRKYRQPSPPPPRNRLQLQGNFQSFYVKYTDACTRTLSAQQHAID